MAVEPEQNGVAVMSILFSDELPSDHLVNFIRFHLDDKAGQSLALALSAPAHSLGGGRDAPLCRVVGHGVSSQAKTT